MTTATTQWLGGLAVVLVGACGGPVYSRSHATGGSNPDGGTVNGGNVDLTVSEDITADTTWAATPADCDILVTKEIKVMANLTIAAGARVCFQADTGLMIAKTGSLHAVGTMAARITLTGTSATPGYWKGVALLSNNSANALHFVDVSYAGSNTTFCCGFVTNGEDVKAAVVVGDEGTGALVSIQNSTLRDSGAMGVFAFGGSRLTGFATNLFSNNAGAPLALSLAAVEDLDVASVYSGGAAVNGKNVVRVLHFTDVTSAVTMKKLDVPYGMSEGAANQVFNIGAALTINEGARLEFEANSGLLIAATGQLTVAGTSGDHVVLTGRSPTAGFWKGVATLSGINTMSYTDITFGGNDSPFCCGFLSPFTAALVIGDSSTTANVTISDVTVTQSKNRGVGVLKGVLTQTGTNDLVTGNGQVNML